MARSANQKLKLLLLRQYLERNSDEAHPVTTAQLLEYLASEGISAERKSIYSDLEALQSFGLDLIRVRDGNITCWYIGERVFQLPELRLLADSVQSSRFITRKKSLELIAKLEGLTSVHQAKELRRQVVVKNRIKAMNESIYYLVDELHTAINGDKRIRFHYTGYDGHGRRVLRRGGAWYDVSPMPCSGTTRTTTSSATTAPFPRSATSAWTRSPICVPPETGAKGAMPSPRSI